MELISVCIPTYNGIDFLEPTLESVLAQTYGNLEVVAALSRCIDEAFARDPALARRFPASPAAQAQATESLIKFVPDRPGHDRRYAMDGAKIARELGFRPGESFDTGLGRTLRWYLDEEPWWRAVMDGSYREWIEQQYGEAEGGR